MKARIAYLFILFAAAGTILLSCEANGGSIYATIETEQKATTNTLPTLMTVADIVVQPSGTYYVAAGGIFRGVLDTVKNTVAWTPNNPTGSTPAYPFNPIYGGVTKVAPYDLCNSLAYFNTHFWGGFSTGSDDPATSSNNVGLVRFDATATAATGGTQVSTVSGGQVTMLRAEGSYLFMSTATSTSSLLAPTYDLEYSSDGATWATVPGMTSLPYPVVGMAYDGTNYWAVTRGIDVWQVTNGVDTKTTNYNVIYKGASPGSLSVLATPPALTHTAGQPNDGYNDIFVDPTTHTVFVPSIRDGVNVSTDAGATWTAVTTPAIGGTTPVSFLTVSATLNPGTNTIYLAGSDGYGYYTLSTGTNPATLTRQSSTTILLYGESVSKIIVDGSNVLMGTNLNGVWRTQFGTDGNLQSGASWTHESGGATTSTG